MKRTLFALLLLTGGCQKDAVAPDAEKAAGEVELVTQGRNRDCGVAQVYARDSAEVARVVNYHSRFAPIYLALKLDTALWVRGTHTVYARIRQIQASEAIFCTAMGPGYPPFVVVSARLKPGTN